MTLHTLLNFTYLLTHSIY